MKTVNRCLFFRKANSLQCRILTQGDPQQGQHAKHLPVTRTPATSTSLRWLGEIRFVGAIGTAVGTVSSRVRSGIASVPPVGSGILGAAVPLFLRHHTESILAVCFIRAFEVQAGIGRAFALHAGLARRAVDPGAGISHASAGTTNPADPADQDGAKVLDALAEIADLPGTAVSASGWFTNAPAAVCPARA
jgi:hypothetical protein